VLNGIKLTGAYEYYSYYQEYAARDEEPAGQLIDGRKSAQALPGKKS
jgi:hypothetical protein